MQVNKINQPSFGSKGSFVKQLKPKNINVHILDNGEHACSMMHFADSLMGGKEGINEELYGIKYLDSIEKTLKSLNLKKGDFVAIPALVSVHIQTLSAFVNEVLNVSKNLVPKNLKENQNLIIKFFEKLYKEKDKYPIALQVIDSSKQNKDRLFPFIETVNELTQKGVNIYTPIHPDDYPIKSEIDKHGLRNELYKYIATSKDDDGKVKEIINRVKDGNNYLVNLLTLANLHVVDYTKPNGEKYVFSARDNLVNDSARGVYNFCPIRDKSERKVLGFSFHDDKTVEFKAEEFPNLNGISRLLDFVGLNIRELLASPKEIKKLKQSIKTGKNLDSVPDKLYPINEIYSQEEIDSKKINVLGDYITKDLDFVFDVNKKEQVLFQKNNCEGSERPSVVNMHGPCFSTITAIARDIGIKE